MGSARLLVNAPALWLAGLSVWLVGGCAAQLVGFTPWLTVSAVTVCLTVGMAQRVSWTAALASAGIIQLAALSIALRVAPAMEVGMIPVSTAVCGLLGAAGIAVIWFSPRRRVPGLPEACLGLGVGVLGAGFVTLASLRALATQGYEWAMRNDAVWNLVTMRLMIADGGIDGGQHPNASPLTAAVFALAADVGRADVAASDLLLHDVGAVVVCVMFFAFAAGVLAALIGHRAAAGRARWVRALAAVIAGVIPLSWFVAGFATQFGFFNAMPTVALLLATWIVWQERRVAPGFAVVLLSLSTLSLLATWAPAAVVPCALLVAAVGAMLRRRRRLPRSAWGVALTSVILIPVYIATITLSDLRRDGQALAVDGAFMAFGPLDAGTIAATTIVVALLGRTRGDRLGHVLVVGAAGVGVAYLLAERVGAPSVWGYYPAKLAWFVSALLLVLCVAGLIRLLVSGRTGWRVALGLGAAGVVPLLLMAQVPPTAGRLGAAFTPVSTIIALETSNGAATQLFELAEPGRKTLVLDYIDAETDRFINSWLLQLESVSSDDPIRSYSYTLADGDLTQTCEAVAAWDGGVLVVTSDPGVPDRFRSACPRPDYSVAVVAADR